MKYNRSLDLLCAAVTCRQEGKIDQAAKLFESAVKCSSISAALKIVEASNSKAHANLLRASRLKAGTDSVGEPDQDVGNELKIEPEENNERIVQESAMDDGDGDECEASLDDMDDEDDEVEAVFRASARPAQRTRAAAAAPVVTKVKTTANSNFNRALRNLHALEASSRK